MGMVLGQWVIAFGVIMIMDINMSIAALFYVVVLPLVVSILITVAIEHYEDERSIEEWQ